MRDEGSGEEPRAPKSLPTRSDAGRPARHQRIQDQRWVQTNALVGGHNCVFDKAFLELRAGSCSTHLVGSNCIMFKLVLVFDQKRRKRLTVLSED